MARRAAAVLLVASTVVAMAMTVASPASAQTPTPPQQPGLNQLGGPGPCTVPTTPIVADNAAYDAQFSADLNVWVWQPGGTGSPTRTGGTCNDNSRPVLYMTHGYWCDVGPDNTQVISNMVSNGYVVVFANYPCDWAAWEIPDAGFAQSAGMTARDDTSRIGVMGHSWGGGMVPNLINAAASRGWGSAWRWVAILAGTDWCLVCAGQPLPLPAGTRVLMVVYEEDTAVPPSVSAILFDRFTGVSTNHKRYVTVRSDCRGQNPCPTGLTAGHLTPVDATLSHLDYYGTFRNLHAFSDCARNNTACTANLAFMGTWSDGVAATPALVTTDP